jgi:SAM-dependent methyltransferase
MADEIAAHYASGYEATRLTLGCGKLEEERTRDFLKRFLPKAPAVVLDVGGGPGAYACWLARQGYAVHLLDVTPLHVELAWEASRRQPETPLASAEIGNACVLPWDSDFADAVLLLGPLYHLTDRENRLKALHEASRVLKPHGVLLAVGISRFASTMDGIRRGLLKDPQFAEIARLDLQDGHHRNPTGNPEYFMDTFFHHPAELRTETEEAGFRVTDVYGLEGPGWMVADFDEWWTNPEQRELLLELARTLEKDAAVIGMNAHLMVVGRKPG